MTFPSKLEQLRHQVPLLAASELWWFCSKRLVTANIYSVKLEPSYICILVAGIPRMYWKIAVAYWKRCQLGILLPNTYYDTIISPLNVDSHQSSLSIQCTVGQGHLISDTNSPPFSRVLSRNLLIWSGNCGPNSSQRTSGYHVTIDRELREVGQQQALHVAGAHPKCGSSNCREDARSVCRPNIAASEASWHLN